MAKNNASARIIAVFLIAALILGLMGCGSQTGSENVNPGGETIFIEDTEPASAETFAPEYVEIPADQVADIAAPDITQSELYNENGVVITATDAQIEYRDIVISLSVQNNSTENVAVVTQYLCVNGYMLSMSSLYCAANAGETSEGRLLLYHDELKQAGIDIVSDVKLWLRIYNPDTYEDIALTDGLSLDFPAPDGYTQSVDDSGTELFNSDGIRMVFKGIQTTWYGDQAGMFFFENTGERNITLYPEQVSANGTSTDTGFWVDLRPNTRALDTMSFYNLDSLNIQSVDELTELELTLHIIDTDTQEDILVTDPITIDLAQ